MSNFAAIIVSNTVLAGVLALLAICVTRFRRNPRLAHALWLLVLVKLVTPPVVGLPIPQVWDSIIAVSEGEVADDAGDTAPSRGQPLRSAELAAVEATVPTDQADISEIVPAASQAPADADATGTEQGNPRSGHASAALHSSETEWLRFVFATAILGSFVFSAIALWRHRRFLRVLQRAESPTNGLLETATAVSQQLGLTGCPNLGVSRQNIGPVVATRWWQAIVLVPYRLLREFTPQQTRCVLAHEFAHVRRRDYLIRWFELFVLALHWWNPIAWLASRQLRRAAEECCDAIVVGAFPGERRSYGEALLRTVEFLTERGPIAPVTGTALVNSLFQRRIEMIMKKESCSQVPWVIAGLALMPGILVLPLGVHAMPVDEEIRVPEAAIPPSDDYGATDVEAGNEGESGSAKPDDQTPPLDGGTQVAPDGRQEARARHPSKPPRPLRFFLRPDETNGQLQIVSSQDDQLIPDDCMIVTCDSVRFTDAGTVFVNAVVETALHKSTASHATIKGADPSLHFSDDVSVTLSTAARQEMLDKLRQLNDGRVKGLPDDLQGRIETYQRAYNAQARVGSLQNLTRSPDETLLAGTSKDSIHIFNRATAEELRKIAADQNGVSALTFSPDGVTLASSGGDQTVRFWNVATGKQVNVVNIGAVVTTIMISSDGRELGVVTSDGVRYYELPSGKLLRRDKDAKLPIWPKLSGQVASSTDQESPLFDGKTLAEWLAELRMVQRNLNSSSVTKPLLAVRHLRSQLTAEERRVLSSEVQQWRRYMDREQSPDSLTKCAQVICDLSGPDFSEDAVEAVLSVMRRQPVSEIHGSNVLTGRARKGLSRLDQGVVTERLRREIEGGNPAGRKFAEGYLSGRDTDLRN